MRKSDLFPVHAGWRLLLHDLGINASRVLRRAGLPQDLFVRADATTTAEGYLALWRGLEEEAADPLLGLRIGQAASVEWFDPPLFAALCSPDLTTALGRLARYKRLIGPVELHVTPGTGGTRVEILFVQGSTPPPKSLMTAELVFHVQLARLATRSLVYPLHVASPEPLEPEEEHTRYFGRAVQRAKSLTLVFSPEDASRPFLTVNEKMWRFFEPELRRNLGSLTGAATTAERARGALLELLPAGESSMAAVAGKLGMSPRTLQRRLADEQQPYQQLLDRTREKLARHYLKTTRLSGAEIAFLIGFGQPSSFFRAFNDWTGQTPEQARKLATS
ncbi:AraC family transcriptional regulator ligand-binding domain-containing protein [Luteolibacter sp. LG18]|uniref:AraC family transcriptional regulator n=1 Tax=Luteolibacter sp. LG18 TaxID=2819286 RepID=UPI002B2F592A|nr:AraC family transcriptional regulator [Luteolibacter sp. LG18]